MVRSAYELSLVFICPLSRFVLFSVRRCCADCGRGVVVCPPCTYSPLGAFIAERLYRDSDGIDATFLSQHSGTLWLAPLLCINTTFIWCVETCTCIYLGRLHAANSSTRLEYGDLILATMTLCTRLYANYPTRSSRLNLSVGLPKETKPNRIARFHSSSSPCLSHSRHSPIP